MTTNEPSMANAPFEYEVIAEGLCNVECPTLGPQGWLINVCSISRPTEAWKTRGGDITATRIEGPRETHVLMNTSTRSEERRVGKECW